MVTRNVVFERVRCVAIVRVGVDPPVRVKKFREILSVVTDGSFILVDFKLLVSMINCIKKFFAVSENSIARN